MKTFKAIKFFIILTTILVISANSNLRAQQDISSIFSKMIQDTVQKYSQIITNSISADLNSGLFQVTKEKNKFSVYVGIKAFGSFLNDRDKFPGYMERMTVIPLAIVQVGVGSFMGTDVFGRFLPKVGYYNYGSISAWGLGIQHNFAKDFKKMPFDITVQFVTQNFNINDSKDNNVFSLNSLDASLMFSKRIKLLTLYSTIQYESTGSEVNYNITVPKAKTISVTCQNDNKIRIVTGFNLKMGPINFNADYNFGQQNAVSAGIGCGL